MIELVPGDLDEALEAERLKVRILRLQAALQEALDGWTRDQRVIIIEWGKDEPTEIQDRITELRKEFLDE